MATTGAASAVTALPTWPLASAADAVRALASCTGGGCRDVDSVGDVAPPADPDRLDAWMEHAADVLGVELELVSISYPRAASVLLAPPILVRVSSGLLAVVDARGRTARVLGPEGEITRVSAASVVAAVSASVDATIDAEVEAVVAGLSISVRRLDRVRRALRWERLKLREAAVGWLLRAPPREPLAAQARHARLGGRLRALVIARLAALLAIVAGWAVIGDGMVAGWVGGGVAALWALFLATSLPLTLAASWHASLLTIDAGALLKRAAFAGSLELDVDRVRAQGVGQHLGTILELQAIEALGATAAFAAIAAVIELAVAAILLVSAIGASHLLALVAWVAVTAALGAACYRDRRRWIVARLRLTHDLVERMVGQRTRLVQEAPERWHLDEDRALAAYLAVAKRADRATARVRAVAGRGWLLVALAVLGPALVAPMSTSAAAVAIAAIVLAYQAFGHLGAGLPRLADGIIAWRAVRPLLRALATRPAAPPVLLPAPEPASRGDVVIEARRLRFAFPGREEPVLDRVDLVIRAGERWLVTGPSGSGKSTLGSLLLGLREPTSGLLLVNGLDRSTLGREGWRRRVGGAPQSHENHIFSGTLAFNVLLARQWPPSEADLREAEEVCRDLGLGPLLDRMPAGMDQMLGETGWRLSHGERARIFVARALLQDAELLILDESLAALDPQTLCACVDVLERRARTLLVIAHP